MKKSQLKQLIKEVVQEILRWDSTPDTPDSVINVMNRIMAVLSQNGIENDANEYAKVERKGNHWYIRRPSSQPTRGHRPWSLKYQRNGDLWFIHYDESQDAEEMDVILMTDPELDSVIKSWMND
jgi:hypothetical protein